MKKTLTRPQLLAWLKAQAEEAYEGFVEDMNYHVGDLGDWYSVDDNTPYEKLLLLINHESEIVKILVKHRIAGHSVYGPEVHEELDKFLQKDVRNNGRYDMGYKQGRFYSIATLYEELGEKKLSAQWKSWAWFDPYN